MQRTIAKPNRGTPREIPRSLALALFYVLLGIAALTAETSMAPAYLDILRRGDATELRRLLDQGADPNARDNRGNTALMIATVHANPDAMRLLLERGATVNTTNAAGANALMLAARPAQSHRAVALLLSAGADARATNQFGGTALMAAAAVR